MNEPIADITITTPSSPLDTHKEERRPWVERYRPSALEEVVAHEQILSTLKSLMDSSAMPHLLFYGPPGTGKTTTVHACAKYLFGSNRIKGNVLEINASDDRGIDVIRNEIKDFASTGSMYSGMAGFLGSASTSAAVAHGGTDPDAAKKVSFKLVVLDEADQMSHDAQAALRRVIEKYTKNVRFCIICNHVNKIIPAVQSRCTRFRFAPVSKKEMLPRLQFIATTEKVASTTEGLSAAFKLSNGDMRRCLNLMQACALSKEEITENSVYEVSGNPKPSDVSAICNVMLQSEFTEAFRQGSEFLLLKGVSMTDLIRELHILIMAIDFPPECKWFAMMKIADIEHQLASGSSESIALAAVIGTLQLIKETVTSHGKKDIFALAQF